LPLSSRVLLNRLRTKLTGRPIALGSAV